MQVAARTPAAAPAIPEIATMPDGLMLPAAGGTLDHAAYLRFLQGKFCFAQDSGFAVMADAVHPMLKPHQQDLVVWACRKGRAALFAAFGLGKSFMQLEVSRLALAHAVAQVVLIGGVINNDRGAAALNGLVGPAARIAFQAATTDGTRQLPVFGHEHAGARTAVSRAFYVHHRCQRASASGGAVRIVSRKQVLKFCHVNSVVRMPSFYLK